MDKSIVEQKVVAWVLMVRAVYLATGASPLKHWDQIQERIRMAARTSETVAEWVTSVVRSLGLPAPGKECSSATVDLIAAVPAGESSVFFDHVESEYSYIMALARLESERRASERKARHVNRDDEASVDA